MPAATATVGARICTRTRSRRAPVRRAMATAAGSAHSDSVEPASGTRIERYTCTSFSRATNAPILLDFAVRSVGALLKLCKELAEYGARDSEALTRSLAQLTADRADARPHRPEVKEQTEHL